jgi:hypothetical protein
MKLTLQSRLQMALESRGFMLTYQRRKYLVMDQPGSVLHYYLGNAGSLRRGYSYTNSTPVNDRFKSDLLNQVPATITKVGTCRIIPVTL